MFTVLLVDDMKTEIDRLKALLQECWKSSPGVAGSRELDVISATSVAQAIKSFEASRPDIVIADVFEERKGDLIAMQLIEYLKEVPDPPFVLVSSALPEEHASLRQTSETNLARMEWANKPNGSSQHRFVLSFLDAVREADGRACRDEWLLTGSSTTLQNFLGELRLAYKSRVIVLRGNPGMELEIREAARFLLDDSAAQVNIVRLGFGGSDDTIERLWHPENGMADLAKPEFGAHLFLLSDLQSSEPVAQRLLQTSDRGWTFLNRSGDDELKVHGKIVIGLMTEYEEPDSAPAWQKLIADAEAAATIPALADRQRDIPALFEKRVAQESVKAGHHSPKLAQEARDLLVKEPWSNSQAFATFCKRFARFVGEIGPGDLLDHFKAMERPVTSVARNENAGGLIEEVHIQFNLTSGLHHTVYCWLPGGEEKKEVLKVSTGAAALLLNLCRCRKMAGLRHEPVEAIEIKVGKLSHIEDFLDGLGIPEHVLLKMTGDVYQPRQTLGDVLEEVKEGEVLWARLLSGLKHKAEGASARYDYQLRARKITFEVMSAHS